MATTNFSGPVVSAGGFTGAIAGAVTGNVTGNVTGTHYDAAAPTAYVGAAEASRTISPAIAVAALTKAEAELAYTLAAPGASNINKYIMIYTTAAHAHVVTVTGLLGGTTMTYAAAVGSSMLLYAISATAWAPVAKNGVTQT